MKKNVFCKCIAAAIAAALILCGCQSGNDGSIDIDIAPDPDITTENNEKDDLPDMRVLTPFIMPQEDTEEYLYYSSKMEAAHAQVKGSCIPGYLYLKNAAEDLFLLLVPYEFDEADGLYQYEREVEGYVNWRYVYGVAKLPDGEKILKVDKITGSYTVAYTPASGKVELMTPSERHGDNSGRLFFKDGNRLCALDPSLDQVTVCAESESGITDIKCETFVYERINKGMVSHSDAYVCEKCGSEYFALWADGEGQYYWYHVHSGESEAIDFQLHYYPFYCFNDLVWKGSESEDWELNSGWNGYMGEWELYARDKKTREEVLLLDDVTYYFSNFASHLSLAIVSKEVSLITFIDERTGETEPIYEFQSNDAELVEYDLHYTDDGMESRFFLFRDGDRLIRLDCGTALTAEVYASQYGGLEIVDRYHYLFRDGATVVRADEEAVEFETLFEAANGITEVNFPYFAEVGYFGMQENFPDEDISDFYMCEECHENEDYIIWADNDKKWFWYHPHMGENEPINIDTESYTGISDSGWEYQISYITRRE